MFSQILKQFISDNQTIQIILNDVVKKKNYNHIINVISAAVKETITERIKNVFIEFTMLSNNVKTEIITLETV